MRGSIRIVLAVVALSLTLLAPQAARAHQPLVHQFPIQAYAFQITYVDLFTGHCCFKLAVETTWESVGESCGYLRYVDFYYYDIMRPVTGGVLWIQNGSWNKRYDADLWKEIRPNQRTGPVHVNEFFCGGYADGRLGVITQKSNTVPCDGCESHWSNTGWYRPPS